ncbi:MAG: hypothetical protein N2167_06065 [Flavobacteriales bacterium]|nr:hypothetical protein [Flavobacteriales bacterium]
MKKTLALLLLLSLILISCSESLKKGPCDQYFVKCKINQKDFVSNLIYVSEPTLPYYTLEAIECGNLENKLILSIPKPLQIGFYNITAVTASDINLTQSCRALFIYEGHSYTSSPDLGGTLQVNSWNESEKILNGGFAFQAQNSNGQIEVTEGEIKLVQFK